MYLAPNVYCTMWRYTFSIRGGFKIEKKKSNIVPAVDGHCTFSRLWEKECKKRRGRNNKGILMDNKSV